MKKYIAITLKILAIAALVAAAAYGIYKLLNYERKPIAVFESNFDDDPIDVDETACEASADADDAVSVVDKCMPY